MTTTESTMADRLAALEAQADRIHEMLREIRARVDDMLDAGELGELAAALEEAADL